MYPRRTDGHCRDRNISPGDAQEKEADLGKYVKVRKREAAAWVAHAEGKDDEAIKSLRALAEGEESTGDEPEDIPAREMLADLLLEAKHPEQALAEYES